MPSAKALTGPLRRAVRRHIGIWRAMEWRNRVAMAPSVPRLRRLEDAEVARLSKELGTTPRAEFACIVPTYRRPDGVRAAVESVLAQDFPDLVVLVVDDGAGLGELPRDPRVHAVSLSRNTAVLGLVRNVGIRLTSSRFLAFLDDDNTWTTDHLSRCRAALLDGADLAYTDVGRYHPDGTLLDTLSRDFDRRALSDDSYLDANSLTARRRPGLLFSRLPRTRATLPKEDWEFVFRHSGGGRRVVHVPHTTVRYLVNPDSFYTSWGEQ